MKLVLLKTEANTTIRIALTLDTSDYLCLRPLSIPCPGRSPRREPCYGRSDARNMSLVAEGYFTITLFYTSKSPLSVCAMKCKVSAWSCYCSLPLLTEIVITSSHFTF